jgi:hypothetical protein
LSTLATTTARATPTTRVTNENDADDIKDDKVGLDGEYDEYDPRRLIGR